MEKILASTPETNLQLLKRSFLLYRASFSKAVILAFILSIVAFIPRFLSDVIGQDIFQNVSSTSPARLWLLLINLVSLIFFIGILWHMHCVIRRKHEPLIQDFNVGIKKIIFVVLAAFIQSIILLGLMAIVFGMQVLMQHYHLVSFRYPFGLLFSSILFFAQIFLLLYVAALFYFLVPLITIENKNVIEAFKQSVTLVWNHWWRTFSMQMTPWVSYIALLIVIKFIFDINIHIYLLDNQPHSFATTLFHLILFTLFVPWVAAVLIIQLKDLELRKKLEPK